jgi:uncharacterized protein YbaR (Trm112 family)
MAIQQELLDILVCPETKQAVAPAPPALLQRLNTEIRAGKLRNRGGDAVTREIQEALVREDGRALYVVDDGIPVMLIEESIVLAG